MKIIEKEVKQEENIYIFYNIIELLYLHYRNKLSKKIIKQLYKLYKEALKEIEKDYVNLDIIKCDLVEKLTFEDTRK